MYLHKCTGENTDLNCVHLFNYTNQMPNFLLAHTLEEFLLHVSVPMCHLKGENCASLLKTKCHAKLLSMGYVEPDHIIGFK